MTKNSARLDPAILQVEAPVPEAPNCAGNTAATLRIIWFC